MNYRRYFELGVSYQTYVSNMAKEVLSGIETKYSKHFPINMQRTRRIEKTFDFSQSSFKLNVNLKWLVISEHWCGDSAQILPVINKLALASSGKIELRIIYRDENIDFMNAHLTNGALSIPKLIQMNSNFEFMKSWGPRPKAAQELVMKLKSNPETAKTYSEELHKWYAIDKQKAIVDELLMLLE